MAVKSLLLAGLVSTASAVKLFVASYTPDGGNLGAIQTLELTPGLGEGAYNSSASLKSVAKNEECKSAPSWLDLSLGGGKIVCVDEGFATPNATLVTLTINADGSLKSTSQVDTIQGPVATKFYNNNTAVALAHYRTPGAIQTFKVSPEGAYTPLQNFTFNSPPGPKPEQDAAHIHQAVSDPSGKYMIFPDLGSDLVRVYGIDPQTALLTEHESLKSKSGYGPRHAVFWSPGNTNTNTTTFLFVIHELANRIISYQVGYLEAGGLTFQQVDEVGLYGNQTDPDGTRAAEISLSPDNKFVIASNRNATIANVPNPDPSNSTEVPSDSVVTFKPSSDGKLSFIQLKASGGKFPRHFSLNKDGSMIAIANQNSLNVDVYARNIETGVIGDRVASAANLGPGGLTNVQWWEG